ncbi:hypothetical protein HY490_01285 [Candidatus Woesearchaeota archaeon]|nr:hypothetical protein [Candidatus Woesearchaeota archaeon]
MEFQHALRQLHHAIGTCSRLGVDPFHQLKTQLLTDYRAQQLSSAHTSFHSALKVAVAEAGKLDADMHTILSVRKLCDRLKNAGDLAAARSVVDELSGLAAKLQERPSQTVQSIDVSGIPVDIKDEVGADLSEVHKCFESGCYRSVVILCGRLMETALHRKYYEATGNDLLEKAPGIGLGNLIAKMSEQNIPLDPGLSNQIHLINQVRIFSVHKKSEPFAPSKEQAQAILLYTIDVFNKLFGK